MRVILLNDTSNNDHYGCFAVSNGLRGYFDRRDDVVVVPIFNRQLQVAAHTGEIVAEQRVWLDAQIAAADYVVVNGEGTLHAGRAPEIELALAAARRLGKPFCVANSILRDYAILGEQLGDADFVTLRDDRSVAEAERLGVRATRCADAALFARFEAWSAGAAPRGVAATDWHGAAPPWVRERVLAAIADGACFLPFRHPAAWSDWPGIVARLAGFRHVVCGRYHGALLAILAGCEVTLLRSNTDKIEELARELGLQAFWRLPTGPLRPLMPVARSRRRRSAWPRCGPIRRRIRSTRWAWAQSRTRSAGRGPGRRASSSGGRRRRWSAPAGSSTP